MTRREARNPKAFTVIELMVAVVIVTLLVSLASVGYGRYRDKAAMLVDETNQKVLLAAVKLYAYDNNALPGSLSRLRGDLLERAYALVTEGKRPYTLLAFLEEQLGLLDIAEAAPLPDRYLGDNPLRVLTCPLDSDKPDQFPNPTKHSYGITSGSEGAANKSLRWLLNPDNAGKTVIVESDTDPATNLARRHDGGKTFIKVSASGIVDRDTAEGGSSGGTGNTGSITRKNPPHQESLDD